MDGKYTKTQLTIAKRLREKREENGYTLEGAAKHINVSKVTLHRYERLEILNIPYDKIETLARLYNTTPAYIMGWDEEKIRNMGNLITHSPAVTREVSGTYKWVARNIEDMDEEELERLQAIMEAAFQKFFKDKD